jgi:hypothetical protein
LADPANERARTCGLDARLRLIIAEYEEYLVDDEATYDKVP